MKRHGPPPRVFTRRLEAEANELRKKMLLLGYISAKMADRGGSVFLVGGQAVETYTGGTFTTGDIDITTTNTKETESILSGLGFAKEGMIWIHPRLGMAVHLVSSYPKRAIRARTIEVDEYSVKVVGVEDLIVDRLAAAKYWKSERDGEQARAIYDVFKGSIDQSYLAEIAKAEMVEDLLDRVRSRKKVRNSSP